MLKSVVQVGCLGGSRVVHVAAVERRRQLVEAAFRVVAREGVAGATTRRIAAEAGVASGIVHYCFRSTQELFAELFAHVRADVSQVLAEVLQPGDDAHASVRSGLRALWAAHLAAPERNLALHELSLAAVRDDGLAEIARAQLAHDLRTGEVFLRDVARRTGARWGQPVPVLSRVLLAGITGVFHTWLLDHDDRRAVATLDALAAKLCYGTGVGDLTAR